MTVGFVAFLRDLRRLNLPPIVRVVTTETIEREQMPDGTERVPRSVTQEEVEFSMTLTVFGKPFPRRRA